ncbi:MAG TPA: AmmeMemoRadiSam system radical SAM enzyme [Clostridiales bacterium]|nr:AmmeMemoRadiSam system radical SAM enzyme [Clostridiales bacterium]
MKTVCSLCPHHCAIDREERGFCRGRKNVDDVIICENYGKLTALALDPIEKKPLRRFFPGSFILSVGSYGCNMRCPFCQNYEIAMEGTTDAAVYFSPAELVTKALELTETAPGNLGVAFTYNEPLISYEYVMDTAKQLKKAGLKTVLVTNGMICEEPLKALLPYIDAMNIDLKGYTEAYYRWLKGDLKTVKNTIETSVIHCHVEVTTLIVPGKNDSEAEMAAEAAWLSSLDGEIPLHISRFFPRYQVKTGAPTSVDTIDQLCKIAKKHLKYVYAGNC